MQGFKEQVERLAEGIAKATWPDRVFWPFFIFSIIYFGERCIGWPV